MKCAMATLLAVLAAGGALKADDIWLRDRKCDGAAVLGVMSGKLRFRWKGQMFDPALADVKRIALDGQKVFNEAEALLAGDRFTEAVAAYDRYVKAQSSGATKTLALQRKRMASAQVGSPREILPTDLSTPETFLQGKPASTPKRGADPAETALNEKEHAERVKTWQGLRVGKKVQWTLEVLDVRAPGSPAAGTRRPSTTDWFPPDRITVVARSEKGTPVRVTFSPSRRKELGGYTRGQFVLVAGTVTDPKWTESASFTVSKGIVVLAGRTIAPAQLDRDPFWVPASTRSVVYLVDARRAARKGAKRVVRSVVRSVMSLKKHQSYCVIFYGPRKVVTTPASSTTARSRHSDARLLADAAQFRAAGRGGVIPGLEAAFRALRFKWRRRERWDLAIYLVAGADFADSKAVREWIKKSNARCRFQIHTVCSRRDRPQLEAVLKQIAADNGGRFAYADAKAKGKPAGGK